MNVRKYKVLTANVPGPCDDCRAQLRWRRWAASALIVAPFLFGSFLAGAASLWMVALLGTYGLYIFRVGSYGWADELLYGNELASGAAYAIPQHPDGEGIAKFPAGWVHTLVRYATCAILGLLLALVGSLIVNVKSSQGVSDLEFLNTVRTVYLPVDQQGAHIFRKANGIQGVVAYTTWEGVPAGTAEQTSPIEAIKLVATTPSVEGIVFDPGPREAVVLKKDFARFQLMLPGWNVGVKNVTKP